MESDGEYVEYRKSLEYRRVWRVIVASSEINPESPIYPLMKSGQLIQWHPMTRFNIDW